MHMINVGVAYRRIFQDTLKLGDTSSLVLYMSLLCASEVLPSASLSVCLYVCLCAQINREKRHVKVSRNVLCMLALYVVALASSFSDDNAVYVMHFRFHG